MAKMSVPILVDVESIRDYLAKADIVEVIRCKDCALRDTDGCQIRMSMYGLKDDDFCSYGDRGETE